MSEKKPVWSQTGEELLQGLNCSEEGLTGQEADRRLETYGPNELQAGKRRAPSAFSWNSLRISW